MLKSFKPVKFTLVVIWVFVRLNLHPTAVTNWRKMNPDNKNCINYLKSSPAIHFNLLFISLILFYFRLNRKVELISWRGMLHVSQNGANQMSYQSIKRFTYE